MVLKEEKEIVTFFRSRCRPNLKFNNSKSMFFTDIVTKMYKSHCL